jgi:hypothetical protein
MEYGISFFDINQENPVGKGMSNLSVGGTMFYFLENEIKIIVG